MEKPEVKNKDDRRRLAEIIAVGNKDGAPAAEHLVVEFLQNNPKSSDAFIVLSRILLNQDKFDDAIRAAEKARMLEPMEAEPLNALGMVHMRNKDHASAEKFFAEAISLDPSSRRAHHGALFIKYAAEDYDGAIAIADHILTLKPDDTRAEEVKLRIFMKTEDKESAIELLKSVVVRNATNDSASKAFMRLMRAENRGDEAYAFIEQDAKANPADLPRARRLARLSLQSGRTEEAVAQYRHIFDEGSTRPDDRVLYITALTANKQLGEAEAQISDLGDRRIVQPISTKLRGDIALAKGNATGAIELFSSACKASKVDQIPASAEAKCETSEEKAKLWSNYTRKMLMARAKDLHKKRRAARAGEEMAST